MEPGDDNERANAYKRYIYNEFANIVHNYDDTASVDHDNIVYDDHDLDFHDGAEYDDNGDPVHHYGLLIFFIHQSDPDDYVDGSRDDDDLQAGAERFFDAWVECDEYLHDSPPDNLYRFPLYNPVRGVCKRPYGFHYDAGYRGHPPV